MARQLEFGINKSCEFEIINSMQGIPPTVKSWPSVEDWKNEARKHNPMEDLRQLRRGLPLARLRKSRLERLRIR